MDFDDFDIEETSRLDIPLKNSFLNFDNKSFTIKVTKKKWDDFVDFIESNNFIIGKRGVRNFNRALNDNEYILIFIKDRNENKYNATYYTGRHASAYNGPYYDFETNKWTVNQSDQVNENTLENTRATQAFDRMITRR